MTFFWPFLQMPIAPSGHLSRRARLQDLDARMTSFLSEKQAAKAACPEVLDNVKAARTKVQREMATAR